jgi:uncharacterized protein (DUF924 family)
MTAKPDNSPHAHSVRDLLELWFDVDTSDAEAIDERMRRWFSSTADEDRELGRRFGALARDAAAGTLDSVAASPRGRLGLILLLDQLPRNLHRGRPEAFAGDAKALALSTDGMDCGQAEALAPFERVFFCMPLQHAEDRAIQARSVATFTALATLPVPAPLAAALRECADYAVAHRDIVERFGRFPHRNRALGRESTPAELEFLAAGGASFGQ